MFQSDLQPYPPDFLPELSYYDNCRRREIRDSWESLLPTFQPRGDKLWAYSPNLIYMGPPAIRESYKAFAQNQVFNQEKWKHGEDFPAKLSDWYAHIQATDPTLAAQVKTASTHRDSITIK